MQRYCSLAALRLLSESLANSQKRTEICPIYPRPFDIWPSPIKDGPISQYKDRAISKDETISPLRARAARLRRGVLWVIFRLLLLIPKVNRLRRRGRLWSFVRIIIALAGVAILAVGVASRHSHALVAAGALILLFALGVV